MRLDTSRIPVLLLLSGLLLAGCGEPAPEALTPVADSHPAPADAGTPESTSPAGATAQVPPPKPGDAPPPIEQAPAEADEPVVKPKPKPKPTALGRWKPYFDALPFEMGPKRGLSKAKALGKPVFMFYAATW